MSAMRSPRIFFHQTLTSGVAITLASRASGHVCRTLRLGVNDHIVLFDGSGNDFDAVITTSSSHRTELLVGNQRESVDESLLDICLLQGLCRSNRMDTVIQKATELGVRRIQAVITERSVVKLDHDRIGKKLEHWRQITISAAEQCGRSVIPDIPEPVPLPKAIENHQHWALRLMLDPAGDQNFSGLPAATREIALLVGPEGGFTDAEQALARHGGFQPMRLGPRILRTETAPVVALSILQFLLGDL